MGESRARALHESEKVVNTLAFQDQIPDNDCYGCGPTNAAGLRIKSYWQDGEGAAIEVDEALCTFVPTPAHCAGPPQFLNGGIIATIVDCHSVCTAIAAAYRTEDRPIGSAPLIWYVTASLHVDYLRPTPLDRAVVLRARLREVTPRKAIVRCSVWSGADECARAEVVAVRVPATWRGAGE
jgi:acyl-coenzyme A thioesterase PaaI-like protein